MYSEFLGTYKPNVSISSYIATPLYYVQVLPLLIFHLHHIRKLDKKMIPALNDPLRLIWRKTKQKIIIWYFYASWFWTRCTQFMLWLHHHHHIVLAARISLTLSRHSSLSFIALGRSSGQQPVSSHSCWMYVRAGRPAFARPCVGIHKSTSLMSSSLLL